MESAIFAQGKILQQVGGMSTKTGVQGLFGATSLMQQVDSSIKDQGQ